MPQSLFLVTLVVDDYDRAKDYYCQTLGFECSEDKDFGGGKRWVVVRPPGRSSSSESGGGGGGGAGFLLARASGDEQSAAIGRQSGGRVSFFLKTDDFARDHAAYAGRGVRFLEEPRYEAYGTVAVFEDLYGNKFDLIQDAA